MKKVEWKYKKSAIKDVHGSRTPRKELINQSTGAIWKYVPEALDNRMTISGENDCWDQWKGAWHRQGFPMFPVKRENDSCKSGIMNAQRLVMAIELGRPLIKEERVFATCQNVACLNPAHLKIGDRIDCIKNKKNINVEKWPWTFIDQHLDLLLNQSRSVIQSALGCTTNQASNLKAKAKKREIFLRIQAELAKKKAR